MALDLLAAATTIADTLTAAGVRAVVDPRDANPPCVLVSAPTITAWRLGDCADATFTLYALAPDAGTAPALSHLSALLAGTRAALGGKLTTAAPVDLALPEGGTVPGYLLTYTTRIPA